MFDESTFHSIAEAMLMHLHDQLEEAYDEGDLEDLELEEDLLTITTEGDHTFIVSKHTASQQIWLASPISGGLHFSFDTPSQSWKTADGHDLKLTLARDLESVGVKVYF